MKKMTNMCCPHCGCKNIQVTTETNVSTTGKNYSGSKGCLGLLMFGPLGLLCGSCGEGQKTTSTTSTYWVCPNCGHKFESPHDLRGKSKEKRKAVSPMIVIGIIFTIAVFFICNGIFESEGVESAFPLIIALIFGGVMCVFFPLFLKGQADSLSNEADSIEEQMRRLNDNLENANNVSYYANHGQATSQITRAPERQAGANEWKCPKCGVVNQNYVGTCGCGTRRP